MQAGVGVGKGGRGRGGGGSVLSTYLKQHDECVELWHRLDQRQRVVSLCSNTFFHGIFVAKEEGHHGSYHRHLGNDYDDDDDDDGGMVSMSM